MNTSVRPGDDFYEYVNGEWIKSHPVPSDKTRYGSFVILTDRTYDRVKSIVTDSANNTTAPGGSLEQKIGEFYRVGMDSARAEKLRMEPLRDEFRRIDEMSNASDVQTVSTRMLYLGMSPLFALFASPDNKNSRMMIATLSQGGLGLPDRDYYFRQDNKSNETRAQYVEHAARMFALMGDSPDVAQKNAQTIMRMETRLANASFTNVDDQDQTKTYNKMSIEELQAFAPEVDWKRLFKEAGCPEVDYVNVRNPSYFKEMSAAMADESVDDWKAFLRWNLISATSSYLSSDFINQSFDFYSRKLNGQLEIKPRWKRVLDTETGVMGGVIGQAYVDRYFDSQSKARMVDLVSNLKKAFAMRIQNLTWMEPETKKKALEKLDVLEVQVGYPDEWMNYTDLEVKNDSYVQNALIGSIFQFHEGPSGVSRIGKPVNRNLWSADPQTVNAFADYNLVLMIFPAGILQPPFFNPDADDAINYGAIGSVIGHEMTHNFDSEGRKFDATGNMTDWWTPEDEGNFNNSTRVLVDEYSKFEVLQDVFVNGNLTLAENIADFGGVTIAYQAYRLSQKEEPEKIDGFTGDQRFFLSNAQIWRESNRNESLRNRALTDSHSPARSRVEGNLFNVPQFYEAFPEIQPGDKLYRTPDERPVIW